MVHWGRTYELARLCAALDVSYELLLLLLELATLAVELTLCFGERTLVLPQPFGWGDCTSEQCFLHIMYVTDVVDRNTESAYNDVHRR
jgi:hypothetical protein